MKTEIRTLLAFGILGFIGLININATTDHKKGLNADGVTKKVQMLTSDLIASEDASLKSAGEPTALGIDDKAGNFTTDQNQLLESVNANADVLEDAASYTKMVVDREEAKFLQKLNAKSESLIEAELFTKWVVDQQEAKLVEKLYPSVDLQNIE